MEARASSLEAKLRKQEQVALHARAKNASLEQALERAARRDAEEEAAFSPAAVAAAAGGGEPPLGAGARFDADVANLIEHSETLERVCQEMKGKLVVAEKQVAQLREQVQAERQKLPRRDAAGWKAFLEATGTTPLCGGAGGVQGGDAARALQVRGEAGRNGARGGALRGDDGGDETRGGRTENAPRGGSCVGADEKSHGPGSALKKGAKNVFFFYP